MKKWKCLIVSSWMVLAFLHYREYLDIGIRFFWSQSVLSRR